MTAVLQQTLQDLCRGKGWSYAIFWKLKFFNQTVLLWEDGFTDCGSLSDCFESPGIRHETDYESLTMSVSMLSYHVYTFGEGLIGRTAFGGCHEWIYSPMSPGGKVHHSTKIGIQEMTEKIPTAWQHQFDAGIKTVVLVAVPGGVVQLGSLDFMIEDFDFLNYLRGLFSRLGDIPGAYLSDYVSEPDKCSFPMQTAGAVPVSPFPRVSLYEISHGPSAKQLLASAAMEHVRHQRRLGVMTDNQQQQIQVQGIDYGMEGYDQWSDPLPFVSQGMESSDSMGNNGSNNILKPWKDPDAGLGTSAGIASCYIADPWLDNMGFSLPDGSTTMNNLMGTVSDHCLPHVNSLDAVDLSLNGPDLWFDGAPKTGLLEDILVPPRSRGSAKRPWEEYSSSHQNVGGEPVLDQDLGAYGAFVPPTAGGAGPVSFIKSPSGNYQCGAGLVQMDPANFPAPVAAKRPAVSSAARRAVPSALGPSPAPVKSESGSAHLGVDRKVECKSSPKKEKGKVRKEVEAESEAAAAASEEKPRPRPRDRQLIQDRLKDLRGIIPETEKCSIDSVLEKTIHHIKFLEASLIESECFDQVEECLGLNDCQSIEEAIKKRQSLNPFLIENIPNLPGHFLIEMLCNYRGTSLEFTQCLRRFGLIVKRSSAESRDGKLWGSFFVESQRPLQKEEIVWQVMQALKMVASSSGDKVEQQTMLPRLYCATA